MREYTSLNDAKSHALFVHGTVVAVVEGGIAAYNNDITLRRYFVCSGAFEFFTKFANNHLGCITYNTVFVSFAPEPVETKRLLIRSPMQQLMNCR